MKKTKRDVRTRRDSKIVGYFIMFLMILQIDGYQKGINHTKYDSSYNSQHILQMKFHTVVSTIVNSTMQKAWPQLWRKAYQTKDFIPNLKQLTIHQKNDYEVLRTMSLGQLTIRQRIIKDDNSHTVYFHNIEGSVFNGLIYNSLYYNQHQQLVLEFGSDAVSKKGDLVPAADMFGKTLEHTRAIIEEHSK